MKKIVLLMPFILFSGEISVKKLINNYQRGHYKYVCLEGYKNFRILEKDEDLLSMYAFSCLRSDYIDRLAVPLLILGKTKESRKNRAYFSLILAQKNILISALTDGEKYTNLHVPTSDHIISKVFNLYFQKKYKKIDNIYEFFDKNNKNCIYRVYIQYKKSRPFLVIEEIQNKSKKIHIYR
ncbi:hypothetical protein NitYY0826_C1088 [Nitratiruptor sp. YY08-26]|uniref:hypothetical protein n=1 Tax=unclassified Nitratiruptor TaxID=2624044 RepID=UPI001916149A|nr:MULTISPECIES: hypothetical protein [unclassified Nitratiruptor]BCD62212.1 hypothetical protein NitYY0813_C1086 [Nitratiruptor sp. YY08-13]BCD66148.1 hypothetical protein NitYY0826_C1088 [Nitratiruptor sp. YY08-26]